MEKIKMILLWDDCIGKTSIITQYINKKFSEKYIRSISNDKSIKEIELKNKNKIKIEICDIIGLKPYRSVNKKIVKNTKIALLVCDI